MDADHELGKGSAESHDGKGDHDGWHVGAASETYGSSNQKLSPE
jgi:hypothetical protein